ncbi:RNA polymerase sigma factor [Ulvibacterium sp.]|uniref:RNA polymerase sigma factor n=1 Tax=Ulvibacterium sp. TaxID=2665914 RepID=UPI003BAB458A
MEQWDFQELSDDKLLSLIKEGNQMAFQSVYQKYWEGLYASVINILKDKGLTEDVLHEVFVKIWTRREELEIRNLKSYLFKAARNNALLKIRNRRFIEMHEEVIAKLSFNPIAYQKLAHGDLKKRIEQASKSLPKRCRTIFFMSRYQEYSISEIAEHFNISHRTVENQLHIALKHLRQSLGRIVNLLLAAFPFM